MRKQRKQHLQGGLGKTEKKSRCRRCIVLIRSDMYEYTTEWWKGKWRPTNQGK